MSCFMNGKRAPRISNNPKIFAYAFQEFTSLWYEYTFLRNSINGSHEDMVFKKGNRPLRPISILGLNVDQNVTDDELSIYLKAVRRGATLEVLHFLEMFLLAERFLKNCDSGRPWELPQNVPPPNKEGVFFGNVPFDTFLNFNNVCTAEVQATRHCLLHNRGIRDRDYKWNEKKYFSDYVTVCRDFENRLKDRSPEGLEYLDIVLNRMNTKQGHQLPMSFEYLYHTQMTLLDRIGLKCGYYAVTWSLREGAAQKVFSEVGGFTLKPFY